MFATNAPPSRQIKQSTLKMFLAVVMNPWKTKPLRQMFNGWNSTRIKKKKSYRHGQLGNPLQMWQLFVYLSLLNESKGTNEAVFFSVCWIKCISLPFKRKSDEIQGKGRQIRQCIMQSKNVLIVPQGSLTSLWLPFH